MNEIVIRIELNSKFVFPVKNIPDFLDVVYDLIGSYGVNLKDIHDLRLTQNIDYCYLPYIYNGKLCDDKFRKFNGLSTSVPKDDK